MTLAWIRVSGYGLTGTGSMTERLRADNPRLTWQGAVSLERTDQSVMPWRIPHDQRDLFGPEGLIAHAAMPAGVRIAFHSDTRVVAGSILPEPDLGRLDLCCDGETFASVELADKDRFAFGDLPEGRKLIELWLPPVGRFRLQSIEISIGSSIAPFEDTRPRWIAYGSSITQCAAAESPTQTWPAIVARQRGLNLTCLGFGGQCHLDPMVARMIRDLPADLISMCVGINIHGQSSMSERTFRPAVIGFVQTVRDGHPDTPLVVMSPIYCRPRETTPNAAGIHLEGMRAQAAAAVDALRAHGDTNVHYVSGLDVFGPELAHLLPDELHPSAEGYKVLGRRFLDTVIARVFPPR